MLRYPVCGLALLLAGCAGARDPRLAATTEPGCQPLYRFEGSAEVACYVPEPPALTAPSDLQRVFNDIEGIEQKVIGPP
jgi:hypothetical protein